VGALEDFQLRLAMYETKSTAKIIRITNPKSVRKKKVQSGGVKTSLFEAPTFSKDA